MSPIPDVVWQQPPEAPVNYHKLDNKHNDPASNPTQTTKEHENKRITDVASQTSPTKGFQLQNSGTATEHFGEKSGNEQVLFLGNSNSCSTDIQVSTEDIMATPGGDSTDSPLTSTTPHIEESLVRYEQTN